MMRIEELLRRTALIVLAALVLACRGESPRAASAAQPTVLASADVIDSIVPIDVALRRFRSEVPRVDRLHSTVSGRDALVRAVVVALSRSDTTTVVRLALNLAEYAWLYYPSTKIARPPYELPPALAWFQLQEKDRKGVLRALRELGGHRVDFRGYRCDATPMVEGENRIWTGCVVTIARDGARPVSIRLFGGIIERDGRFEVLSYENDF